jgi:capsular exopolysaccharide synthesis family protein
MGRIEEALRKSKARDKADPNRSATDRLHIQQEIRSKANEGSVAWEIPQIPPSHYVRVDKESLRAQRIIAASEHDDRVFHYRQLRTLLLKTMRDNQWSTLAVSSAHKYAGKSVTAANLAISLARDVNTTVLLVDLDLNTPTVHEKLNLSPEKGLVDFLEGNAELDEIMFDPGIDGLTVLAGRSAGREVSELLGSPKMQQLVADLCHQNATVITIFDLPPLLRNDDAILFAPYADATLVVVEVGVTTKQELRQTMRLLEKANVIGTILNKARD